MQTLPGAALLGFRSMSACEECNIRRNITVVAQLDRPISMDRKISSKPAVDTCYQFSGAENRTNYFGTFSQRIADSIQQSSLHFKQIGSGKNVIDQEHKQSVLNHIKIHIPYQLSFKISLCYRGHSNSVFHRMVQLLLP